MKKVTIICDLQFGSTGKGLIAGYLAKLNGPDTVVTAWNPNAGHTFVDRMGNRFVHTMLANGVVSPNLQRVMIAPGSLLNLDNLAKEITECHPLTQGRHLVIHENAGVVSEADRVQESVQMVGIGSTMKGCGAALVRKIQRQVDCPVTVGQREQEVREKLSHLGMILRIVDTQEWLWHLGQSDRIQVEGAQGFSLGINSGFYPYCTSRECTPAQIMSDCLISPRSVDRIVGVMRTYPIRVANRYDKDRNQIGYSGPGYTDQEETTFHAIGVPTEYTTVTKLPRRVFTFSLQQTEQALRICSPDDIFLNFANYLKPDNQTKGESDDASGMEGTGTGRLSYQLGAMVRTINYYGRKVLGKNNVVRWLGFGPAETDVNPCNL